MRVAPGVAHLNGKGLSIQFPHEGMAWATMHGYKQEVEVNIHWMSDQDLADLRDQCQSLIDRDKEVG